MRELYPPLQPHRVRRLAVTPPHELYIEEAGNAGGVPVLFVHGGPGSGCEAYHRRFFDPQKYRIILFDQRGAGKSTPHAALQDNTTQALVQDMEAIREELGIEQWVLFGGSWGSTLSLVYAQTHPERVMGLILRGIFLCRPREIQWFYQEGANRVFPDLWEAFLAPIPQNERRDMVSAYYKRLTGEDELTRMAAAKAWSLWEGRAATLQPSSSVIDHFGDPHVALALARIECHYFKHNAFLEDDQILRRVQRLADIPGYIVHGRYDMICPLESAWQLHRGWPLSELNIVGDAGHAASEPGIVDALLGACESMLTRLT